MLQISPFELASRIINPEQTDVLQIGMTGGGRTDMIQLV